MKTTLVCTEWRVMRRNTLLGFATIQIKELRLTIFEIAIYEKDGRRWVALPARPQLRDGTLVTGDDGKGVYHPILGFDSREVAKAFSNAVIAAVLDAHPGAFDGSAEPQRAEMDDAIPF